MYIQTISLLRCSDTMTRNLTDFRHYLIRSDHDEAYLRDLAARKHKNDTHNHRGNDNHEIINVT